VIVAGGVTGDNSLTDVSTEVLDLDDIDAGWTSGPDLPEHRERITIVNGGPNGNPIIPGGYDFITQPTVFELIDGEEWITRNEEVIERSNQVALALNADDFGCE